MDFNLQIRPLLVKKCYACHGPDEESREGGLALHLRDLALGELDSGELGIVPGDPEASEVFVRVNSDDEYHRMPPADSSDPLTADEIQLLKQWIESGAKYEPHWSFKPVQRAELPPISDASWAVNPIDHFIAARLEKAGLRPAEAANKATLIRRVSLDLTGLPPTPEEVAEFLESNDESAYEKLLDRLLQSPQFGEHFARRWLDLARYADSQGYAQDELRTIWPYRDWVIRAYNADMTFDQFTIEQLAGDLLPSPTIDQLVATGFHRNTMTNTEGGTDDEEFRIAAIVDRTNTTGQVWMGLTMGCAQCHTHKFDPISQHEYYEFFAIFNQTADTDRPDNRPTIAYLPPEERKELEQLKQNVIQLMELDSSDPEQIEQIARQVADLKNKINAVQTYRTPVMNELAAESQRKSFVAIRGSYKQPGDEVQAAFPGFHEGEGVNQPDRLKLAQWLTDGKHPLTARVEANRIWEQIFGVGIVETSEDFGSQGTLPSHPQLLDWLASELMDNGWSRKKLIKTILMSATYRQSSQSTSAKLELDPL